MVSVVGAVHIAGDVDCLAFEVFESYDGAGAVGDYSVAVVFIAARTEVGENVNGLELICRFIEVDTVRGKSYFKTVLVKGIFKAHTESRRSCVCTGIAGELVVVVEFFVCVVRAEALDNGFKLSKLSGFDVRVAYINCHFKSDRELSLHFGNASFCKARVVLILLGIER